MHSALQLPVRNHNNNDLNGTALQRRFSGKQYLITDEMSMLGQRTLAWVDKRIQQATGKLNKPLGGISLMLLGDFAQLPPVGDKPIYASPSQSSSLLTQYGHSIHGLFETVVMLKTFDRLETTLRQNNFKQYSFAYEMVSVLKMTG